MADCTEQYSIADYSHYHLDLVVGMALAALIGRTAASAAQAFGELLGTAVMYIAVAVLERIAAEAAESKLAVNSEPQEEAVVLAAADTAT